MSIIASPPRALLARNPTQTLLKATTQNNILAILSPALTSSLYLATLLQRLLSSTTLRGYVLSLLLLRQGRYASQGLLYTATKICLAGWEGIRRMWKGVEPLRNKLFFEFMVFILGGGNGLILLLFWPGWILIGGIYALWWICN